MTSSKKIAAFRREVWSYYKKHGRHDLPWRKTTDPYKILVSEVMLQQTQVPRVIEKYRSFLKKFPTVRALARPGLAVVLKEWSGLGYNKRAKYLHNTSKVTFDIYGGDLKKALDHSLPGVGPYTRAAVRTFAFNESHTFIETNIRTAFTHIFFNERPRRSFITDKELLPFVERAAKGQDPRTWYWALMDYGSHLKRSGVRNNARSKHYAKQSKFEGSLRQLRGAILRQLHRGRISTSEMNDLVGRSSGQLEKALAGLERDGLIKKVNGSAQGGSASGRKWRIA